MVVVSPRRARRRVSDLDSREEVGAERQEDAGEQHQDRQVERDAEVADADEGLAQGVDAVGQRVQPREDGERRRQIVERVERAREEEESAAPGSS